VAENLSPDKNLNSIESKIRLRKLVSVFGLIGVLFGVFFGVAGFLLTRGFSQMVLLFVGFFFIMFPFAAISRLGTLKMERYVKEKEVLRRKMNPDTSLQQICPRCHKHLPENTAAFCPFCGNQLQP
jgi:uncharacterized paraquat-inducible protein A